MSFAVLFPGQGSQTVGMGADLFDARPDLLGERSDAILGWSLRGLCLEGPEDVLTRTEHAQPALFALGYALWQILAEHLDGVLPGGAAGHSLGEYTALAAAEVFDYDTALALVDRRGRAMAAAADSPSSGMAALIGADLELASHIAERRSSEGGTLEVANLNAPGQIVMAGGIVDLEWLQSNARDLGVRRVIPLKVAGAFHSSLMQDAAAQVEEALSGVSMGEPRFPVWSNTTAKPHQVHLIAETLVSQVTSPVRFQESLEDMAATGIDTFIHVGPGDVTAGMARRTVPHANVLAVSSVDQIQDVSAAIGTMA